MPLGAFWPHCLQCQVGEDIVEYDSVTPERDELSISISYGCASHGCGHSDVCGQCCDLPVLVSLNSPQGQKRTASNICCVLDTSGSMKMEAQVMGESGKFEGHGLSLLDIAKHGVRTIVNALGDEDSLSIVVFNASASLVLELTPMDDAGKMKAENGLEKILLGGGTDIFCGIHMGMEILRAAGAKGSLDHIILLTDGETANKDSILPALEACTQEHEWSPATINTFGFGYGIDSNLLVRLANMGAGTYSFIPDPSFVGTTFVNTLSNILVTFAHDAWLSLELQEGVHIKEVLGNFAVQRSEWGCRIKMGTLQYGQSKDVIVVLSATPQSSYALASLQYQLSGSRQILQLDALQGLAGQNQREVDVHRYRSNLVEMLASCVDDVAVATPSYPSASIKNRNDFAAQHMPSTECLCRRESLLCSLTGRDQALRRAQSKVQRLVQTFRASTVTKDERVAALLADVSGEVTLAVQQEHYHKWGRHYLTSLMFAHGAQQCNNFKDPGVQRYGGKLFTQLRDEVDDLFNELPAPKPSLAKSTDKWRCQVPISMAVYNNSSGGCIDGESQVRLATGEAIPAKHLSKGQLVLGPNSEIAEVLCVVRLLCPGGRIGLVELGAGARVTAYHPVSIDGQWVFPVQVSSVQDVECEAVYNFVLAGAAALLVGGVPCVTLGHGLQQGAAYHPYYSSWQAAQDVLSRTGGKDGLVELQHVDVLRDPATGLVCGLRP